MSTTDERVADDAPKTAETTDTTAEKRPDPTRPGLASKLKADFGPTMTIGPRAVMALAAVAIGLVLGYFVLSGLLNRQHPSTSLSNAIPTLPPQQVASASTMNGGESSPVVDPTWYLKHSNGIETDETATASPSAQPDNTPSPLPAPGAAAPSASLPAWVTSGPSGSYSVPAINPGALNGQGVPRKAVHYLDDNGSTAATGAAQPYEGGNAPQPDAGAGGGSPTDIVSAAAYAQQQGEAPPGTVAPAGGQENRSSQDYLDTENEAPRTAYELQAGGVIPAVLAGGINSDFCGNAQAVVSEDVYDSVYQHYLLVPAGSRLTGQCKSGSVYGQNRIFVVWNRLFFPNGHFRDLDGMDSQDQQGMTGINAHVDAHRGNTLGAIALLSVLQGGLAYLSNPMGGGNSSNGGTTVVIEGGGGGQSPAQAVAQSAATQISQLATTMTQQALSQAPTLQVQPGSRFNIAIERDIVFQEPFHR